MVLYGYAPKAVVVAMTVAMTSLATSIVGMRLYGRLRVTKNTGWDDAFITGSMFWVLIIVYNWSLTCTKLSILTQYLRIFPQKTLRKAIWTVTGIVVAYAIWRFFSAVFTCVPVAAFWDSSIQKKTCYSRAKLSLASTTLNMFTDIMIAILPLPYINKLQLPRRQKYALMAVFGLAGFVVIISILRVPSLYVLQTSQDITYDNSSAGKSLPIWSSVESNVAIICSCLPTLRCLCPKLFTGTTRQTISTSSSSLGSRQRERKSAGYVVHVERRGSKGIGTDMTSPSKTHAGTNRRNSQSLWSGLHSTAVGGASREDALLGSIKEDIELRREPTQRHALDKGGILVQTEIEQDIERTEDGKQREDSVASSRHQQEQDMV